jgi:hypothetical protein
MPAYFVAIKTIVDDGIMGRIATLGGLQFDDSQWLLNSSMKIEQLRAALMQNCPDRLDITELADQQKLETPQLKRLGAIAATAPPAEDFAAQIDAIRWRLRD